MTHRTAISARRSRAGMTLLEIIVVVAIALVLTAVMATGLSSVFSLRQRTAASQLVTTYTLLREEAVLRNQTFRIAYHLDGGWYQVEMGDPGTLIFSDPDQREEYERDRASKLARYSAEEVDADVPTNAALCTSSAAAALVCAATAAASSAVCAAGPVPVAAVTPLGERALPGALTLKSVTVTRPLTVVTWLSEARVSSVSVLSSLIA